MLSAAILVGGGWAVYRYWYLERPDAQLDMKRQESQFGLTAYLNIDIRHTLRPEGDAFDLIGDVHIENPGTKRIFLDLAQMPPIRISRLRPGGNEQYQVVGGPLLLPILASEPIYNIGVEGKGSASLKFVARLEGPELYSVEFWAKSPDTDGSWMSYIIVEVSAAAVAAGSAGGKAAK